MRYRLHEKGATNRQVQHTTTTRWDLFGRTGSGCTWTGIGPLHDAWLDYAQSLVRLPEEQRLKGIGMTLEHACQSRTYLVGNELSIGLPEFYGN